MLWQQAQLFYGDSHLKLQQLEDWLLILVTANQKNLERGAGFIQ